MTGTENCIAQDARWTRGRAIYRQMVTDKREEQIRRIQGFAPKDRAGLFGWLYSHIMRVVAAMSPTSRRIERDRRAAQEMRHSRLSRSKYQPGVHQRKQFNQRRAS